MESVFRRSLEFAQEGGFLRGRKLKVAVDTTPIFGAAAVKDTYNLLADGVRQVVRAVTAWDLRTPEEWAADNGLGGYFESSIKVATEVDWESDESRREFLGEWSKTRARGTLSTGSAPSNDEEKHERLMAASELLRHRAIPPRSWPLPRSVEVVGDRLHWEPTEAHGFDAETSVYLERGGTEEGQER